MYYQKLENFAANHPEYADLVGKLDRFIEGTGQDAPFNHMYLADEFGVNPTVIMSLLMLLVEENVLNVSEFIVCEKCNTKNNYGDYASSLAEEEPYHCTFCQNDITKQSVKEKALLFRLMEKESLRASKILTPNEQNTFNIVHLSDLHFGTMQNATNWSSQLKWDISNDLQLNKIDCLVISGDVGSHADISDYEAAKAFLDDFCPRFDIDSSKLVIVPGNHDVNWPVSEDAYSGEVISNHNQYKLRFSNFSNFFNSVMDREYSLEYDEQFSLLEFPEFEIVILGLNSAWENDHINNKRAGIKSEAVTRSLNLFLDNYKGWIKIAVWHHPIHDTQGESIRDTGYLERLSVADFRLALHGHIHMLADTELKYDRSPNGRGIHVIGAGTFGAPTTELTSCYPWEYNVIQILDNTVKVKTRRREEENGAWKPYAYWTQGAGKPAIDCYEFVLGRIDNES